MHVWGISFQNGPSLAVCCLESDLFCLAEILLNFKNSQWPKMVHFATLEIKLKISANSCLLEIALVSTAHNILTRTNLLLMMNLEQYATIVFSVSVTE